MGSPVRVLHAVVNMNRGGAETLIMNLYRHLDRSAVQFDFLTSYEGEFDEEIVSLGGRVHRLPALKEVGHFQYLKAVNDFFERNKNYAIVHAHMDRMSGHILSSAKRHHIPIRIAHSHSTLSEGHLAIRSYKWYAGQKIRRAATDRFACSQTAGSWLFGRSVNFKRINNSIDSESFKYCPDKRMSVRKEFGLLEDQFVLGHVGRFSHPKNHTFLIHMFLKVVSHIPQARLLLVGEGPLRENIMSLVKRLKLEEHIVFLGKRADISDLLTGCDAFVFPSLYEGLPVSLVEAQASGLPCLVSDHVTHEIDIGAGLIQFLTLRDSEQWVKSLVALERNRPKRQSQHECVIEKGFNIIETSTALQSFYLKRLKEVNHDKTDGLHANL
ncbi:glycosyltransferase family 1 protein [Salipaludibacillus sp. LMS25]|jgi:glycosyltransferase involved in cell wall biosynthesis|uniref:glycosyltransferase family 1 protein n=1 Tax=Salipaludibacillus sp. LMS25 TaxID=2924031 RepID=UPI0020D1576C|nr:glycosyltransferase family 1 protein [Salipaludibacillus sp. LMS25]UTR14883.1 glycosyltransferase family 1 protein [Salipaludibacillus sp. LMS25]